MPLVVPAREVRTGKVGSTLFVRWGGRARRGRRGGSRDGVRAEEGGVRRVVRAAPAVVLVRDEQARG